MNMSSMIQPADLSIGQPSNPPKPPRHQGVDDQQLEDSISLQRGHSIHYLAFRAGMGHNWPILSWFGHCGVTQVLRGTVGAWTWSGWCLKHVLTILKNMSQWEGLSIYERENKKCSKPPTSDRLQCLLIPLPTNPSFLCRLLASHWRQDIRWPMTAPAAEDLEAFEPPLVAEKSQEATLVCWLSFH